MQKLGTQSGEMQRNKLRVEFESGVSLKLAETSPFPLDFLHTSSDSLRKIMGPKTGKEVGKSLKKW